MSKYLQENFKAFGSIEVKLSQNGSILQLPLFHEKPLHALIFFSTNMDLKFKNLMF